MKPPTVQPPCSFPDAESFFQRSNARLTRNQLTNSHLDYTRRVGGKPWAPKTSAAVKAISPRRKVLDYGCGWGRISRLLPYYFADENIFGDRLTSADLIDPEQASKLPSLCFESKKAKNSDSGAPIPCFHTSLRFQRPPRSPSSAQRRARLLLYLFTLSSISPTRSGLPK